jgi:hypothetical protein
MQIKQMRSLMIAAVAVSLTISYVRAVCKVTDFPYCIHQFDTFTRTIYCSTCETGPCDPQTVNCTALEDDQVAGYAFAGHLQTGKVNSDPLQDYCEFEAMCFDCFGASVEVTINSSWPTYVPATATTAQTCRGL